MVVYRVFTLADTEHRQIQHIYDNTAKEYPGIGILTAANRNAWAKVRRFA